MPAYITEGQGHMSIKGKNDILSNLSKFVEDMCIFFLIKDNAIYLG